MNIALWTVQGLLATMYSLAGGMKTFQTDKVRENPQMGWAKDKDDNYIRFIGISELLGALGMILPILTGVLPWLTPVAAIGLTIVQILAIFTVHLPRKEYPNIAMNVVFIIMQAFVVIGRWNLFG